MKTPQLLLASLVLFLVHTTANADVNVLVVGSTQSYLSTEQEAFDTSAVAAQLESILQAHSTALGNVTVNFDDVYRTLNVDTAIGSNYRGDYVHRAYSLAQYYFWPDGRAARLSNIRAADYVVMVGDPYLIASMPGYHAEGVRLIAEEAKAGGAIPILLMPWPRSGSSTDHFGKVAYRIGNSLGIKVAPGGYAWDRSSESYQPNDSHPNTEGAYIAAASIYSAMYNESAAPGNALADLAQTEFTTAETQAHPAPLTVLRPFAGFAVKKRNYTVWDRGTSTESYVANRFVGNITSLAKIGAQWDDDPGKDSDSYPYRQPSKNYDFNFNRGNRVYENEKHYLTSASSPESYDDTLVRVDAVFGFSMQDYGTTANTSMLYGMDYQETPWGSSWDDIADLQMGLKMIQTDPLDQNIRNVPVRLISAKLKDAIGASYNTHNNNGTDFSHMSGDLQRGVAGYLYTAYSGRLVDGNLACRIGSETAYTLSTLQKSPGFVVLPSAASATTISPSTTETMTVQFFNPPTEDVTVTVTTSDPTVAIAGPYKLLFTPQNYNIPQSITVKGVPGSATDPSVNVVFNTSSDDEAYNGLSDSWSYTNNRTASSVSYVNRGTVELTGYKNFPLDVPLNASGASAGNTTFTGPSHGILTWDGADVVYTPNADYIGPDGFAYYSQNGNTVTTGSIDINVTDGAPEGSVRTQVTDAAASEEGTTTAIWSIIREGDTTGDLVVNFTMSGSATLGVDYTLSPSSSQITILSGNSSAEVTLTAIDDATFGERDETALLTITAGSGYTEFISSPDNIVISDNDNNAPEVNAGANRNVNLLVADPTQPLASGGTVSNYTLNGTNYITHTFSTVGNNTLTFPYAYDVDYLIVAGGGGGGNGTGGRSKGAGGGGGAGGLLTNVGGSMLAVTEGAYSVTVGDGGAVNGSGTEGSNGGNSILAGPGITNITAIGGGGGGKGGNDNTSAKDGGSGGGGGSESVGSGSGTAGQGNDGGLGDPSGGTVWGGGGGGAGEAGNTDGNGQGGDGVINNITGSDLWYAGGGGGAVANDDGVTASREGGTGGGGAGLASGTDGLGGGGGGGGRLNGELGGAGGSGVVIVRYTIPSATVTVTLSDAEVIDADELDPVYPTWSVTTKPAGAPDPIFDDVNVIDATVTFMMPGDYVLRLDANDGTDSHSATVTITVDEPAPAADAGVDQTVRDNDENGSELITLDGSGSSDLFDGSIVSYVWNDGTSDIASIATAEVALPVGTHTITLTVTDNDGLTDTDTVVITVEAPNKLPVVSAGPNQFVPLEETAPWTPEQWASGGTVTHYTLNGMNYTAHTFTTGGTLTFSNAFDVEYLIVAGGGGGGSGDNSNGRRGGGGGGAGGLLTNLDGSMLAVTAGAYNVVVGTGGAAGAAAKKGSNGGNSSFDGPGMTAITALGGGGGAGVFTDAPNAGGSGGGASADIQPAGNGTAGQGNAGGIGTTTSGTSNRGGGGGGAGEAGSTDASGYGGDGAQNSITGTDIWYAGGGAGGTGSDTGALTDRIGGEGGGGNSRQAGTDGLGGGGGGGHYGSTAAKGGSGIVIVRYSTGFTNGSAVVQFSGATATDPDGDDLDVFWEVVSTDPPGLPDPIFSGDVTLGTAAATFTAIGKYTLSLTGNDGEDTGSSLIEVTITDSSTPSPTADAGDPQTVTDTDRSGGEDVTLDGSGSSDPNGTIDSYVWNDGTSDITTGVAPTVTLPVGTHTLTLTVTDNEGLTGTDSVVIRVNAPPLADAGADKQAILGAASPAWTPSEIAPAAWYDASDTGSITAAIDGKVSQWNDKSDNGRNATQTTELKQPTSGGDIGGWNALYFDGSDDTMSLPALGLTDDAMMICVYAPNNDSSGYSVMGNQTEANDNHDVLGGSGSSYPHHFRADRIQDVALGIPTSGANMLAHMADSASEYRIRLNGSDTYLNSGAFTFADNVDQIGGTFITFLDGWVGEVIILNDYSLINMQKAEGYLAHKWGLTGNLPVGHPYKDSAPEGSGPAAAVTLSDATVSDVDVGASLSQSWTLVSKPAGAADPDFSSSTALKPTVTFTASGTYELRLTADDSFDTHSDTITIIIDPPLPAIYATWANGDNFANPFNNTALGADPDGDGLSSLLEFAFGTDPTASDSRFMAADGSTHGQPMVASDGSGMWLYYLRRTDHGTAGSITYSTEFSADLGSFTPASEGLVPADVQNANPGYQVMKIPYPAGKRFGRVVVEATPE